MSTAPGSGPADTAPGSGPADTVRPFRAGPGGLVAVVTGASRGLGAAMARVFADEGVVLGLCARTVPEVPVGAVAVSRSLDVSDSRAVEAFLAEVVERFGRIDLWVNNAGLLAPIGRLADADAGDVRRNIEVNVVGVANGTAAFSRHVRSRPGGGVLVNLSSGAATRPYEGWAPYCASKAAVDMLTEVVALEERESGLRAYSLAPGVVDTDMQGLIRSTPDHSFPAAGRFRRLHEAGALSSPEWVARFVLDELVGADGGRARTGLGEAAEAAPVRRRVPDQP